MSGSSGKRLGAQKTVMAPGALAYRALSSSWPGGQVDVATPVVADCSLCFEAKVFRQCSYDSTVKILQVSQSTHIQLLPAC